MARNRIIPIVDDQIEHHLADGSMGVGMAQAMGYLVSAGDMLPPWWSRARDAALRAFYPGYDHVSGIVSAAQTKLSSIPPRIVARDSSISAHVTAAEEMQERLYLVSGLGTGFLHEYKKFILDYLTQDNGGFLGIIGENYEPENIPLQGPAVGVRHLDAGRCRRTGDPEYPVVQEVASRGLIKWHWSRVIYISQMASARVDMNGVGLCPLSRSVNVAQNLADSLNYKLEKMGSRPTTQILNGENMDANEIVRALLIGEEIMNNLGLKNFAKVVALGGRNNKLSKIDLNQFDPFNEETTFTIGVYSLAYIWGMDVRDIWPTSAGGTGDKVALIRSRQRLPADFTDELLPQLNLKLLPWYLKAVYADQDEEQKQQNAIIRDIRSRRRHRDSQSGYITSRAERLNMMRDGEITREDFVDMELDDGRLEDGAPVSSLFYSTDRTIAQHMDLGGIDEPLVPEDNDARQVLREIHVNQAGVARALAVTTSLSQRHKLRQALAALNWLEAVYQSRQEEMIELDERTAEAEVDTDDEATDELIAVLAGEQAEPGDEEDGEEEEEDGEDGEDGGDKGRNDNEESGKKAAWGALLARRAAKAIGLRRQLVK
jgi:hypothetical protein